MPRLPKGTVTFLFTDIERSTRLLQQLGESKYVELLADHRRFVRSSFQSKGGKEVDSQGDAFFYAFPRAKDALHGAIAAQRGIERHSWPEGVAVRVRMALHTGEPLSTQTGYTGLDVHKAARICAAGHGGQILLSQTTRDLVAEELPTGSSLRDLGRHGLKDLATAHLFQAVVPGLQVEFPPLRSLSAFPNNLPRQMTSFVGREFELRDVKRLLGSSDLVTLTGTGGSGKTRLALQVAGDLIETLEDGVFLAELAPIRESALVPNVIARALGLRETSGLPLLDVLKDYLKEKQLLLLLDNFEHVVSAAPLVTDLLTISPQLKVLVTSREPLRLRGEKEFRVPPLPVPDLKETPALDTLSQNASVALFIQRVLDVKPDFQVRNESATAIVEICHRLEGLPLAIELAAARAKILSPEALLMRLSQRLNLLTRGARDLPARQRTLRDTIAWSYDLMDQGEKKLFRGLSIFAGGCTAEAAAQVCTNAGDLSIDILDAMASLVDKNLLRQQEAVGESRFTILETIREYGQDKLIEAGESEEVRRRHGNFYLVLAEEAEPTLTGAEQKRWLDRLEVEHDNLRAALDGSLERGDIEPALRLAGALWRFWSGRNHITEGRAYLKRALEHSVESRGAVRAKALHAAGNLAWDQGDYKEARVLLSESLEVSRTLGDNPGMAASLNNLGNVVKRQGDYTAARTLFKESLALSRALGHELGIARALNNLGTVAYELGEYPEARSFYQESLDLCRGLGHRVGIGIALNNLADVARREGDYVTARVLYQEGLAVGRDVGHKPIVAEALRNLGSTAEHDEDFALAQSLFEEACNISRQLGDKAGIALALEGLGRVSGARGNMERGARLFGAAEAIREGIGAPIDLSNRPDYERNVTKLRDAMNPDMFAATWRAGRTMTVDQAVEYALGEQSGVDDPPTKPLLTLRPI